MAVTDYSGVKESSPRPVSVRDRLVPPMRGGALWGWLGPLFVAVLGGVLRFHNLGHPKAVIFDETYYAKDAYSLIRWLAERTYIQDADKAILAGNTDVFQKCAAVDQCASYVVHPPLGKWMIGVGEWLFGMNPFGWRIAAAVIGTLSILILARVARRMTRSTLLGCFAGLLLALDGLHFVLSRTALLDIFLMFWVLAGFACLVVDRDKARGRLVDWYETAPLTPEGPWLGIRPWRLAAGLCLGAACAVKWSGVFFFVFFIMSWLWDAGARKALGLRSPYTGWITKDVPTGLVAAVAVPALTYVASWTGWFAGDKGWGREWQQATADGPLLFVVRSIGAWVRYHLQVLGFHADLTSSHPYQSEPWSWPLLLRPVAFHYEGKQDVCGAKDCSEAVLGVGTPVIWYGALLALIALIAWYVATRDWRAGAVLLGYAAGWLPWFYFAVKDDRTMFLFYAVPMVPFMVLALTLCAGLLIGPAGASPTRRTVGAAAVGSFALLALINLWWLHPILTAEVIPYTEWKARMLLDKRWI
ncbi:dolichyl-phosphate-mannose--protein mannosyltransferase [Thermoactinospora rubra]|uniref:dolichyl-phosphate-mannose--protein mannosyltransferase n=1 Tax=Thermoactinospora rubra TaxID=1088767 RepID=UPI000A11A817|nr:phospholipid carrier-dependent glycosyltransferase [Thermoactinospora rubra]